MELLNPNATVVELIQFSLAPVFLIVGIGQILNVVTGRLARVIDRARWFDLKKAEGLSFRPEHNRELEALRRRAVYANWAITFLTGAVVIVCIDVILLLINGLVAMHLDNFIIGLFITTMVLITAGLISFFIEVSIANATLKITKD